MNPPLLQVDDLHVDFYSGAKQVSAVRGVSFTLHPRSRLGIVGESGCGKSTAILAVMGLLPANAVVSGQVRLQGIDILAGGDAGMRRHRWRDIAMVFQGAMNAFNPVRTVGEQIAEPIRLHQNVTRRQARQRVVELLGLVGIPARRAGHYPHEFSGGMRQRAALAMALACGPKVLLADEPTTALDVIVQAEILELLRTVTDELGVALVFISHDLPAVAQVAERVAVMYAGRIVEEGPAEVLLSSPRHPYTTALVSAIPNVMSDAAMRSIPGEPPRLDVAIDGCSFAPRCPSGIDACRIQEPPNVSGVTGTVACHLASAGGALR
ncbi:ABC transporter ATP-binding protein [Mycobacterium sp. CVI_P3]|uniref:ABC transporter ATP-binding protein n=1 Tax=Mycobacterium pinniadriaticum TaxID=2994102 RepID=A0ABT3SDE1_9MYCO|nr:ABC transporter ATP-binding protein [Mycobacterium pinniadriaticum]MCX2930483.1 ABC transporter ATP-binding protein [Mycobacterium pinniadriaticum]MCX2936907.1 ABC transporter ATP-binding protein [Mycobacterium pinniadriaticum]